MSEPDKHVRKSRRKTSRIVRIFTQILNLPAQSVYSKALTLFVALSILLGMAIVFLTSGIILGEFEETERQEMVATLQRFTIVLGRETRPVEISLTDWLQRNIPHYADLSQTANPDSLAALQLDFLSVADSSQKIETSVFRTNKARDIFLKSSPWPDWLSRQSSKKFESPHAGFIILGDNLTAMAWQDIPGGRRVAAGRIFSDESLAFLEGIFGARVAFEPLREINVGIGRNEPILAMLVKHEFVVEATGSNELVGHALIRGINGIPIGQVRLVQGRPLYREGMQAVQIFLTMLTLAGGTLFLIVWILLDRTILARISDLTHKVVEGEKKSGCLPLKLEFRGSDELAHLARRIEELAEQLDRAQANYRMVVEDQTDVICRFTPSYSLVFCNRIFQKLFPHDAKEGERLSACLPQLTFDLLSKKFRDLTPEHAVEIFLHQITASDGSCIWFRSTLRGNFQTDGTSTGGQWVAADISSQVYAQQRLQDSERQLRALSSRLLRLQDEERRRLARELHDSTAQSLSALEMNMSLLEPAMADEKMQRIIAESRQIASACCLELRTISYLLHPPLLDEVGLPFAIQWFADGFTKRTSIQTTLDLMEEFPRLDVEVETTLFRIIQEAMSNIYRHSGASRAWITLAIRDSAIFLEIRDNGSGFPNGDDQKSSAEGVGFGSMRERLAQLGGQLEVSTSPYGVKITAHLTHHPAHVRNTN